MYLRRAVVAFAVLPFLLLTLTGCGDANPLNRQAVSGTIKLNGSPLAQGTIEFAPQDPSGTASGSTIKDGTFSIPDVKGLPPGDYLVRIYAADETAPTVELPGESSELAAELVPAKYNSESKETFTVQDGGDNVYELNIESSAK